MNTEKTVKLISQKLNINETEALNLFNNYWKFIEELLAKNGTAEIPDFGDFKIIFDEKENGYKIEFKPGNDLLTKMYGDTNEQ